MKKQTFNDYLADRHGDQYVGLDDYMPDDFADWISNLDVQEVIDYADLWEHEINK